MQRASRHTVAAVVFDMDGTLFDSTACVTAAYHDTVAAAGGRRFTATEIVAAYPLGPPAKILGHLLGRSATVEDENAYLSLLFEYRNRVSVYDGVRDVLRRLAPPAPLAVFTGANTSAAAQLLTATRLLDFFSVVVGGDEVPRPKPEPDGILRACDLLNVSPHRVAYVGDSALDLEAARRGALAIGAAWGHLFDPEAPCDFVARVPHDLLSIVGA